MKNLAKLPIVAIFAFTLAVTTIASAARSSSQATAPSDTANKSTEKLKPSRGAATHLSVTGYNSTAPGATSSCTVSALDAKEKVEKNYTGTVSETSSDAKAPGLVSNYAFVHADNGSHTFDKCGALSTAGTQSITFTDDSGLTGTQNGIAVKQLYFPGRIN